MATDLPPLGREGPVLFAPLTGNMVPLVMLHQVTTAKEAEAKSYPYALVSSAGVKSKTKRVPTTPSCAACVPEPKSKSPESNPHAPVSSIVVKAKRKRL